jgi:transposase
MTTYTKEQIDKARAKEELLRRVEAGEDAAQVIAELGLKLKPRSLWKVRQAYRQRGWEGLVDHRGGHAYKATAEVRQFLAQAKKEDMERTGADLTAMAEFKCGVHLSVGRVNDLLREVNLSSPPGRRGPGKVVPDIKATAIDRAGSFFPQGCSDRDGGAGLPTSGDRPTEGHDDHR